VPKGVDPQPALKAQEPPFEVASLVPQSILLRTDEVTE
jgi:hypothetical protein